jgi:uncharacterized membrane protein YjjP (DUF1212 family)
MAAKPFRDSKIRTRTSLLILAALALALYGATLARFTQMMAGTG